MKLVGESFDPAPWTNESDLPPDAAFACALNLSFSDDVHCLVPADCPQRRVETGKPVYPAMKMCRKMTDRINYSLKDNP